MRVCLSPLQIDKFWQNVLTAHPMIRSMTTDDDENVLQYLKRVGR